MTVFLSAISDCIIDTVLSFLLFKFRDLHHIFICLIGNITFVFIGVLMVAVIIYRLLSEKEGSMREDLWEEIHIR
ncbi:MAG: hypothetical protein ACQEQO_09045 [Thermodesulfobacteriota bacterium]